MFSTLFKKEFKSTSRRELTISKKQSTHSLDQILAEFGINFFKGSPKKQFAPTRTVQKKAKPLSNDLKQIAANQLAYSKLIAAKMQKKSTPKKNPKVVFSLE